MDTAVTLTLAEAAAILEPPLDLAPVIKTLGWKPDSHRHNGRAGRPVAAYDATRLLRLHAALLPFLEIPRVLSA